MTSSVSLLTNVGGPPLPLVEYHPSSLHVSQIKSGIPQHIILDGVYSSELFLHFAQYLFTVFK